MQFISRLFSKPNSTRSLAETRTLKLASLAIFATLYAGMAEAQQQPSSFTFSTIPVTTTNYTRAGYGGIYTNNYHLHFGKNNASTPGINRTVASFKVGTQSFVVGDQGTTPFTSVVVNRVNNTDVSGDKITAFFETPAARTNDNPEGANIYLSPSYTGSMEELINSYVFNRGTDNLFSQDGSTKNNVERIDLIFKDGITAPGLSTLLQRSGILLMERGGNDSFKFAAIKSLSAGKVNQLGTLKSATSSLWGKTGINIPTLIFQRNANDPNLNLAPSQNTAGQDVAGIFISLQDLGVATGETIYGISLFPNDVTTSMNLITLSNVPTNTDGNNDGGLDFMAGGGFFTAANTISGKLFHDAAPVGTSINNHTGVPNGDLIPGNTFFVSLVNSSGSVVATVPVNPNGTYSIYDVESGDYTLVLHNLGTSGSSVSVLGDWFATGEGANATKDGTSDGTMPISVPSTAGSLTQSNFGISTNTSISGNVFNDKNGNIDQETGEFGTNGSSSSLTVYLVDADGKVVNSSPVNALGEYDFQNVPSGIPYSVVLSNTAGITPGSPAPAPSLPTDYMNTGEDLGTNNLYGSGTTTSNPGVIYITPGLNPVTDVSFGIQQKPTADPIPTQTIADPKSGSTIPLVRLTGSDPEDGIYAGTSNPYTIKITSLPVPNTPSTGGTPELLYNGTPVTAGQVIPNYDPTKLTIKLNGIGYTGVSFEFSVIDAAGAESTPKTYPIVWNTPLPITLISFHLTQEKGSIQLQWSTTTEENADRFEIERSQNGKNWNKIGERPAMNLNEEVKNYSFSDSNPFAGVNYYRLKMMDLDGTFAYSRINQIKTDKTPAIVVYPNPVANQVRFENVSTSEITSVIITNGKGVEVFKTAAIIDNQIDISQLKAGIYQISLYGKEGKLSTRRIVVAK